MALPLGAQDEQPLPVRVTTPQSMAVQESLELSGSFRARQAASLSPRLPGLVSDVLVDAGDQVEQGQVLLQLDNRLAQLAVTQAEALRQQALAEANEARRLRDEGQRLVQDRFLPQTEVTAREAEALRAEAGLAVAEGALATARERLARHALVAPFSGVISQRMTEAGEWVETGGAVLQLVDTEHLWLDVRAPQQWWPTLDENARAQVVVDALPGQSVAARVHARVPVSDASARTFLVRLAMDDAPAGITPGMSARVRFQLSSRGEVLQLPRDAIIRYPDGSTTVWVVENQGGQDLAREYPVTVARFNGDSAEISDGLVGDEQRVVIRGNEVLTQDQPVRVMQAASP